MNFYCQHNIVTRSNDAPTKFINKFNKNNIGKKNPQIWGLNYLGLSGREY